MPRKTGFFFDERCLWHAASDQYALNMQVGGWVQPPSSSGLAESPETKRRLKNLLDASRLTREMDVRSAEPATDEQLKTVHSQAYLDRFKAMSDAGGGELGDHAPIGPGTYEIAKLSTGLTIAAVSAVLAGELDNAYSLSRPPGHHCMPDQAMGFCFFSNIAIAANVAKEEYGLERIAVLDWDVHHGNGTQAAFYDRDDVLTISLHQDGCFPPGYGGEDDRGEGRGKGCNINVPLPAGAGDATYLQALDKIAFPAIERFQPELIIVACGFDPNALDPLARMQVSSGNFRKMTRRAMDAADKLCDGKLVMVHEGGYSEAYVPFCGQQTLEELTGVNMGVEDPLADFIQLQQPRGKTAEFLERYVDELAERFNP